MFGGQRAIKLWAGDKTSNDSQHWGHLGGANPDPKSSLLPADLPHPYSRLRQVTP
jgi:hypothetical protein